MPEKTTAIRIDKSQLKLDAQRTTEGFVKARALVSRTGVFAYTQPDGSVLRELRHPDDVFRAASLDTLKMNPVTVEHKAMVNPDNVKVLQVGNIGQEVHVDAPYVVADLMISAKEGLDALANGQNELSCGYMADLVMERGVFDGQAYDARQTNIVYNHLALTNAARLGPELRITMDSKDRDKLGIQTEPVKRTDSDPSKETNMLVKVEINGLQYDAAPEVAQHLKVLKDSLQAEKDGRTADKAEAQRTLDAAKAETATVKADRDTQKAKVDSLEEEAKKLPAKIGDAVKARAALERTAAKVLDDEAMAKIDSMSDLELKKAVIVARQPKAKLDGETDQYVEARYKFAIEGLDEDESATALADSRRASVVKQDGEGEKDGQDAARARMMERLRNGGKLDSELKK